MNAEPVAVQEPEESADVGFDAPELTRDEARALSAALAHFNRTGAAYDAARAEFGLGVALVKLGNIAEAIARYESARDRWRRLGDTGMEAEMLNCLGCAYGYRGDWHGLPQFDQREFRCKAAFQLKDANVKPAGFEVLVSE